MGIGCLYFKHLGYLYITLLYHRFTFVEFWRWYTHLAKPSWPFIMYLLCIISLELSAMLRFLKDIIFSSTNPKCSLSLLDWASVLNICVLYILVAGLKNIKCLFISFALPLSEAVSPLPSYYSFPLCSTQRIVVN